MAPKNQTPAKRKGKPTTKSKTTGAAKAAAKKNPYGLSDQREMFCLEYCKDRNATRAAKRAGYSEKTAYQQGYLLLKNCDVRARINDLLREHAQNLSIETTDVLQRLWDTATGDVNDIVRLEHRACRHCHGIDHEYQWKTQREFKQAQEDTIQRLGAGNADALLALGQAMDEGRAIPGLPDDAGGYGFDATADPNPDCPECHGEGVTKVVIPDTREALSHPLYDGVKQTQHGVEVKIADRAKALEQIARHLQMFKDQVEINASEDLIRAARAISASSPSLDPEYARKNASRLRDLDGD